MKKRFKKIITLMLIGLMILGTASAAFGQTSVLGPLESLRYIVEQNPDGEQPSSAKPLKALRAVNSQNATAGLTINGLKGGETINLYKLVTIGVHSGDNRTYSLNSKYQAVFDKLGVTSVTALTMKSVPEIIEACQSKIAVEADLQLTVSAGDTSVTEKNAPMGLYFVEITSEDDATIYNPILVNIPAVNNDGSMVDATATAKHSRPELEKKIVLSGGTEADDTTASIGEKVDFIVRVPVPKYNNAKDNLVTFVISDTMQNSLTYLGNTVVKGVNGENEVVLDNDNDKVMQETTKKDSEGNTIIKFKFDYSKIKEYGSITMTYSGVLNEAALNKNFNKAYLTYTNKITVNSDGNPVYTEKDSPEDTVWVYTYGLDLTKYELGSPDIKLAGAEFSLQKGSTDVYFKADGESYITITPGTDGYIVGKAEDGTYTASLTVNGETKTVEGLTKTVITPQGGNLVIKGLGEGSYTLKEEKAPEGYYKVGSGETNFTITGEKGDDGLYTGKVIQSQSNDSTASDLYKLEVANSTTYTLPETGGIGMMLFLGAAVIAMTAACLLIYRRRSSKG